MKINLRARDWHNWVSVLLVLPMLLVGFTSLFMAHKKSLGLDDIDLTPYVGWLPGYGGGGQQGRHVELRSVLQTPDGRRLVGTNVGLFVAAEEEMTAIETLAGMQVRDLAIVSGGVLAITREGVWLEADGGWRLVQAGDAWNANTGADGEIFVALKDKGLYATRDGMNWQPYGPVSPARYPGTALPQERVHLGKLMTDLHTGKAFLGKENEWLWIDLLALVWVFLGFTGIWLWWRAQSKRRDAALKRAGSGSDATRV